jgi:hypothetical protein
MAGITGNDRAILTDRAGAARADAVRAAYAPVDTDGTSPTFYMWTNQTGTTSQEITTVWTSQST